MFWAKSLNVTLLSDNTYHTDKYLKTLCTDTTGPGILDTAIVQSVYERFCTFVKLVDQIHFFFIAELLDTYKRYAVASSLDSEFRISTHSVEVYFKCRSSISKTCICSFLLP